MTDITAGQTARDIKTISLVSTVHSASHFYQLVLPSLLPILKIQLGVSYTELGGLISVFYIASGLTQTPAGFLVDRFGARTVLVTGLGFYGFAIAMLGVVPQFWMMLPFAALAGMGNSVFHPADYAVLSANISQPRMARAYSAHTLSGNLGWILAPVTTLFLTDIVGWRGALITVGVAGVIMAITVGLLGAMLDENTGRARRAQGGVTPASALLSTPILMCFAYFIVVAVAGTSIYTFMPTALHNLHNVSLATAATALTGYLIGSSAGIITGGLLADRKGHPDLIIGVSLFGAALFIFLVGAWDVPAAGVVALLAAVGFCSGVSGPSRDLLVRRSSPAGSTGKVFGFVYSGFDVGSAVTPSLLGLFLDNGNPQMIFVIAAGAYLFGIFTAVSLVRRRAPAPVSEPAE